MEDTGTQAQQDGLVQDLRAMIQQRSLTDLRRQDLPALVKAEESLGQPAEELVRFAIDQIDDPLYKHSAQGLLPLPYPAERWKALKKRREIAAKPFGISESMFRTRRDGKPSYEDHVLGAVAQSIRSLGDAADRGGAPVPDLRRGRERRQWSLRPLLVSAGMLVVVVGTVGLWLARDNESDASAVADGTVALAADDPLLLDARCDPSVEPGQGADRSDSSLSSAGQAMADSWDDLTLPSTSGPVCATKEVELMQASVPDGPVPLAVQRVIDPTGFEGAITATVGEDPVVTFLPGPSWGIYSKLVQEYPIGWPTAVEPFGQSGFQVRLEGASTPFDGQIVGQRLDLPPKWTPNAVLDRWDEDVHGYPVTPLRFGAVGPRVSQDFEHGFFELEDFAVTGEPLVKWTGVAASDARREVQRLPTVKRRIVDDSQNTSWYIDEQQRRWWVPTKLVWSCLGGPDRVAAKQMPGWAIGSFELAGVATCEMSPEDEPCDPSTTDPLPPAMTRSITDSPARGCPTGPPLQVGGGIIQQLIGPHGEPSAISLAAEATEPVVLTGQAWRIYQNQYLADAGTVGLPTLEPRRCPDNDATIMTLRTADQVTLAVRIDSDLKPLLLDEQQSTAAPCAES